ncbi:helix-turn-helix domain-containing protein [Treponema zuelzerae]|uniref:Helix-turn-helix domain-containing protein n=1 Tax=Teretinema zuelzerae TaxID=156 RepID=A0AAE3JK40_9SPIR|nr:helix-turn-helix domain-containing protein [Teretinema zuelzerae]MCD1653609.1 helix-turn-helix domain-containing protein [Teretinema zuelzerae]
MATAKNAVKSMESSMTADQIKRARNEAEREILSIRLSELRERRGIKQSEMGSFSQTAVSKLERRKDMKLSTLIEYLDGIGMGLELRVYPKETNGISETEMLLKV